VLPAAADEVSASIAHLFSEHAQEFQGVAGQAAAFHQQFVQNLTASASSYGRAEAASTAALQPANAIASSIASVAASANPVVDLFNAAVLQIETFLSILANLPGYLLYLLLAPVLDPIINAVAVAIANAIIAAIFGGGVM
jgi:hypothetical protein